MAGRGLEDRLVASGALRREAVQMARRRQKVYGGGLDTVLLEMGLVDEGTLWALLVQDTGLAPLPPALFDGPMEEAELLLGHTEARRLGAFAFKAASRTEKQTQAVARPGFDQEAVASVLSGRAAQLYIVPEVRFEALLAAFYGQAVPPRFVSLLGRLMGADQLRRWSAGTAPRQRLPQPPVDVGPHYKPEAKRPVPSAPVVVAAPLLQDASPPSAALASTSALKTKLQEALPLAADKAASLLKSTPDNLLASLMWLFDLQGGPRASSVAGAIANHWSAADIFALLPQLAKRGENVALAALPLLATQSNLDLLSHHLATGVTRDKRWAALATGIFLRHAVNDSGQQDAATRATKILRERLERDPAPEVRAAAAYGLRHLARLPDVRVIIERLAKMVADPSALDPVRAGSGILLGEMRADIAPGGEGLIEGVGAKSQPVSATCREALLRITGHDLGCGRGRWRRWWKTHRQQTRAGWLIAALQARRPDLRLAAVNELTDLTGQTLGYHFDLTAGPRKAAVLRWQEWLATQSP